MKTVINGIKQQLTTLVPDLQYINEDWGQITSGGIGITYPCVLINIQHARYENNGRKEQQGDLDVLLKLYVSKGGNIKEEAFDSWNIYSNVNKAIHSQNFLPEGYGAPMRLKMEHSCLASNIESFFITYKIEFTDDSCVPDVVLAKVSPNIIQNML